MEVLYIILIILGALALSILISFPYCVYRLTFYNKKRIPNDLSPLKGEQYDKYDMVSLINAAAAISFEEVSIKSYDGLKLYGRYYHTKDDAPLHIQFNGYQGNGIRDFAGGLQLAIKLGHNVLLVDQRANGYSEGNIITFGIKERHDCLSWINYSLDRFGKTIDIILDGVSMGAATVLMAASLDLPSNVKGIVADCPYSSVKEIILKVTKDMGINPKMAYPFILIAARVCAHFKLNDVSAIEAVKNLKVPALIIHGTDDRFVPIEMSRKIKDANPEMIKLVEVDGAPHGLSYLQDYDLYYKSVSDFTNLCLNAKK